MPLQARLSAHLRAFPLSYASRRGRRGSRAQFERFHLNPFARAGSEDEMIPIIHTEYFPLNLYGGRVYF